MRYIVTGGAGFIGSNLARKLVGEGHDVTVVDNFHTGSMDNLRGLEKKLQVVKATSCDIPKPILEDADGLFHLGIPSSTPMYRENRLLVGETINEFIRILNNYPGRIVFASSSSVYNGCNIPYIEDMTLVPTDYYTETRIAMERLARVYWDMQGNKTVALRMFSVYGPGEWWKGRYANMVSQILWEMRDGRRPIIYGDGSQTRDFTHVDDAVRAFILAMETKLEHDMFNKDDVFNVGTGSSYSFNDVVQMINDALNLRKPLKPVYVENTLKNYVIHTKANTMKARMELNFTASVSLEEGIKRLLHQG